jgi:beta-glucosidase-like glycosyl hydrolase
MSFNRSLWKATGNQIGREARALMNVGLSYSTFWAPVINLAREPRWGRNLETPGEDPYQVGQYAIQFTEGMQNSPDDPRYIQASACCKHYVLNSMESTVEPDGESENRGSVDSNVTQQDLLDSYAALFGILFPLYLRVGF